MEETMFHIRNATPCDDAAFADLAHMAAGDLHTYLFGPDWRSILQAVFRQPKNLCSYDKTVFLTCDDKLAGMQQGFSWRQRQTEQSVTDRLFLKHLGWRVPWVGFNYLILFPGWFSKPEGEHEYYYQYLAVYPEFRRQAVGTHLFEHFESVARGSDCQEISFDVAVSNTGAINMYQSLGFVIEKEGCLSPLLPKHARRIYRMHKALE
jgi:ribosomal protein S18 acetylase RimI-like enzyme